MSIRHTRIDGFVKRPYLYVHSISWVLRRFEAAFLEMSAQQFLNSLHSVPALGAATRTKPEAASFFFLRQAEYSDQFPSVPGATRSALASRIHLGYDHHFA